MPRPPCCPGALQLLYFGHLQRRKGVFTLAEAIRWHLDQGSDLEVTFTCQEGGQDTPAERQLRQILGPHAASARFHLLPDQRGPQLHATIAAAGLVVLPSLYEPFGYTCLEAITHARPVITTTGTGISEIIEHGRTGFLVPPGDPAALAAAIETALRNPRLLPILGDQARRSLTRYTTDNTTAKICAAYQQALHR